MLSSPSSVKLPLWPASMPGRIRISVPALRTSITPSGGRSPRMPTPSITRPSSPTPSIGTPIDRKASTVASVSAEAPNPVTVTRSSLGAPPIPARWLMDLSPGTLSPPTSAPAGATCSRSSLIDSGRRDRPVALRVQQCHDPLRLRLAGDRDHHGAAAVGRHVVQLEVLDVDALSPQRLRYARQHARPVGHVDAHPVQVLRRGRVGHLQQAAAMARRLGDPARHEPGILPLERPGQGVDAAAVVTQAVEQRGALVREDVHPDARAGPG